MRAHTTQLNPKLMDLSESPVRMAPKTVARPIRVAHFYSSLGVYGAERWALTLIKYLDTTDVESVVITIGTKPGSTAFRDLLTRHGIRTEHLAIRGKFNPVAIGALRQLLERDRIDVLHTHGFKSDILGYLACRGGSTRIVSTPHGWSASEGWRIRTYEGLSRLFLRGFDRIYPLSQALYDDLIRRGFSPDKVKLILNGVDISSFDATYREPRMRGRQDVFRVLYAGRLSKPKGVSDLIRGAAAISIPFKLRIAGEGPDRQMLESLTQELGVADRVEFVGAVESIAPQFEWADVLVLPSYVEGIPRVVMEAFAAGVPVIGTDIPGTRTLIDSMHTGITVPTGDPVAIARAITTLAADPQMARRFALAARNRIEQRFSARRVAEDYTLEYQVVTGR
ncbi:MAG: glycosyltransferase [Betaproteobacteria bacterium]